MSFFSALRSSEYTRYAVVPQNEKYLPFSTVSSKRDSELGRLWVRGDFIRRGSVSLCNHFLLFSIYSIPVRHTVGRECIS